MSQTDLLLLSLILQILRFSTSRSQLSHQKKTILLHYYTVSQSKVQCSTEIVFHLILIMVTRSCHVMSRFRPSLQISIFQIHHIFNISYFPQFNLSFEKKYLFPKMPKNHPNIYTKPPNRGWWDEQKDLASLETWPSYWQKGGFKRRQNSLHVYPRLNRRKSKCQHIWCPSQLLAPSPH